MIGAILISASGRFRTALIPVRPGVVLTQKPANGLADPVDLMACEAARDIFGNEALVVEKLFEGPDRQLGVVRWEPDVLVPGVGVRQIVVDLTVTGAARAGGGAAFRSVAERIADRQAEDRSLDPVTDRRCVRRRSRRVIEDLRPAWPNSAIVEETLQGISVFSRYFHTSTNRVDADHDRSFRLRR